MIISKTYIEDVIYGRKRTVLLESVLRFFSLFYAWGLRFRHALYGLGIFKQKKLEQPVIAVGNLTLGGTGKTPAVINIAQVLQRNGKRPVVVSRGYGRHNEAEVLIVADGSRCLVDSTIGGDEPVLIGSKLEGVPVVVGSDRFKAGTMAHRAFGSDIVLLDDGFQHIRLYRDLDIVLISATDPFGNGRLFPAGILREPLSALVRAHLVLLTGCDQVSDIETVVKAVRRVTPAKLFTSRHVPMDLEDIMTGERKPLSALRGTRVLAASGIARPQAFVSLLRTLGAEIGAERHVADHTQYTEEDLADLFREAANSKVAMIVTTEKDAVRLRRMKPDGLWTLRIELTVNESKEWETELLSWVGTKQFSSTGTGQ